MIQNARFWSLVILLILSVLLFLNFSNKIEYVKLNDWKTPSPTYGASIGCSNFSTQQEAQAFFEANGGPAVDRFNLDGDNDGKVCEGLP